MISLRTYAVDNNGALPGAPPVFCGIPVPVGVRDGDLLVVGMSISSGDAGIFPPSEDWRLLARTDTDDRNVAVYYKRALNEPVRWVFEIAALVDVAGAAVVFSGVDAFDPKEATALAMSTVGVTHAIPGISTSVNGCELLVFLAADAMGTYSAIPSGYLAQVARTTADGAIQVLRRPVVAAGQVSAATATFSAMASGAAVAVALRPSVTTVTVDEVRERIVGALPPGIEGWLDFTPGGDFYKFFQSIAEAFQVHGVGLYEILRAELSPGSSRYLLSAWEAIFGLETSRTTLRGLLPDRQAQVVASWRAVALDSSKESVRAVIGPLLGYADPSQLLILEPTRAAVTALHELTVGSLTNEVVAAVPDSTSFTFLVRDRGQVSTGGAMIAFEGLNTDGTSLDSWLISLTAPDSTVVLDEVPLGTAAQVIASGDIVLRRPIQRGIDIYGDWTLTITWTEASTGAGFDVAAINVLLEGIGRDAWNYDGLGAAIYHWTVLAQPAYLGVTHDADIQAAQDALTRLQQSHTIGGVALSALDGSIGAICSDAIAGLCVCGEEQNVLQIVPVTLDGVATSFAVAWSSVMNPRIALGQIITDGGGGTEAWMDGAVTATGGTLKIGAPVQGTIDVWIFGTV